MVAGLAGAFFVTVAVLVIVHISAGSPQGCSVSAPVPSLPPQLRSLGGFDQPTDAGDKPALQRLATAAAGAVAPGLIGSAARAPVAVASTSPNRPDALVVALLSPSSGSRQGRLVGLVAFLRDCAGRAYYSAVDDLTSLGSAAPTAFPSVSASEAAQRLGTASPQLVYAESPFTPQWRDPASGAWISASG